MNLKITLLFAILITGLLACNNNAADPDFNYQKIIHADSTDTAKNKLAADTAVIKTQTTVTPAPTTSNTAAANTNLNPEHGKPGHRCDIAVGAPLNSKPVTPAPTTTAPQQNQPQVVSTKKTATPAGMNPPHGEPGHRCDIAVGAPLNPPKSTPANSKTDSTIKKDTTGK